MTLNADALAAYTGGRLDAEDEETERVLARALAEARRFCGWHVTPNDASEVVLDGPGGTLLRLPTMYLTELTSVTEDGVEVDLADLQWSRLGQVRKTLGRSWTTTFSGLIVEMTHGFDEAEDFESAVLSLADRRSQVLAVDAPISIGPFRFGENRITSGPLSATPAFTASEMAILEQYRLERPA